MFCCSFIMLKEEDVTSDQSLKEFEGATLRYASINLRYNSFKHSVIQGTILSAIKNVHIFAPNVFKCIFSVY